MSHCKRLIFILSILFLSACSISKPITPRYKNAYSVVILDTQNYDAKLICPLENRTFNKSLNLAWIKLKTKENSKRCLIKVETKNKSKDFSFASCLVLDSNMKEKKIFYPKNIVPIILNHSGILITFDTVEFKFKACKKLNSLAILSRLYNNFCFLVDRRNFIERLDLETLENIKLTLLSDVITPTDMLLTDEYIFVCDKTSGKIIKINRYTPQKATLQLNGCFNISAAPNSELLAVTSYEEVYILNTENLSIVNTIDIPSAPLQTLWINNEEILITTKEGSFSIIKYYENSPNISGIWPFTPRKIVKINEFKIQVISNNKVFSLTYPYISAKEILKCQNVEDIAKAINYSLIICKKDTTKLILYDIVSDTIVREVDLPDENVYICSTGN